MKVKHTAIGAGIATAGILFVLAFYNWAICGQKLASGTAASEEQPAGSKEQSPTEKVGGQDKTTLLKISSESPISSRSVEISKLVESKSPVDAFRAYTIILGCKIAREEELAASLTKSADRDAQTVSRIVNGDFQKSTAAACGDIDNRLIAKRLDYLEIAANAGVPMAALRLASEGPWGDLNALKDRANDPSVLDWRRRVSQLIEHAAENGDAMSIGSLVNQYSSGAGIIGQVNYAHALKYAVAQRIVYEKQNNRPLYGIASIISELTSHVSAEDAVKATEAGVALANKALGGKS